jgi:hypothetical protein
MEKRSKIDFDESEESAVEMRRTPRFTNYLGDRDKQPRIAHVQRTSQAAAVAGATNPLLKFSSATSSALLNW